MTASSATPIGRDRNSGLASTLARLRRRRWLIAFVTFCSVAAAAGLTSVTPNLYEAAATVRISDQSQESIFFSGGQARIADPRREVETQLAVIGSPETRRAAEGRLEGPQTAATWDVRFSGARLADLVTVTVTSQDPAVAAQVANAYADAYVDLRREQSVSALTSKVTELRARAEEAKTQIAEVDDKITSYSSADPQVAVLQAERVALQDQYLQFTARSDELEVEAEVRQGGVSLIAEAEVPTAPSSPDLVRNLILAFMAGVAAAVALAFVKDALDDRVRTPEDLSGPNGLGLATLVPVPAVRSWERSVSPLLEGHEPEAEVFRQLRVSVQFSNLGEHKVLMVASPLPGEGKSTLLANLALSFARAGKRVCLVDLDLRKGRQRSQFRIDAIDGFTSVVAGRCDLTSALVNVSGTEGAGSLHVLPSGPVPSNPTEVIGSPAAHDVLARLSQSFDAVFVDTPAMLAVADAAEALRWVDAVILVAAARKTHVSTMRRCVEMIDASGTKILGVTLNGLDVRDSRSDAYGYGYGYGYGYDQERGKRSVRRALRKHRRDAGDQASGRPRHLSASPVPSVGSEDVSDSGAPR